MSEEQKIYNAGEEADGSGGNGPQSQMSISADLVKAALDRLVESGSMTDEGRILTWWLYCYGRDSKWRLRDYADAIKTSTTTVHRLFNGNYGAAYDGIVASIERFKKVADERSKRREIGFIETSAWQKISRVCNSALYDNMPAFIYGSSQIGKTACLEEFQRRNNHGTTRYVRMPASPSFMYFIRLMAESCYISPRLHLDVLRRKIIESLDSRNLLIVDEVHQAFCTCSESTAVKIIEFLREIYDRSGCGIVLCGTKVFRDEFESGRQSRIYDQLRRRGMLELLLPDTPSRGDINRIAKAFGLQPPEGDALDLIKDMLQQSGLGMYIKFLQCAHGVSVSRKEPVAWQHFSDAYAGIRALSARKA
jgi:DNA transposition AAA+ family ATPase